MLMHIKILNSIRVVIIAGRMYGADDFLPMLTYVMAQCDMPQLDAEIDYMMELLDPSLLNGEGTLGPACSVFIPCCDDVKCFSNFYVSSCRRLLPD